MAARNRLMGWLGAGALTVLAGLSSGCGYSVGARSEFRTDIKTVHVPIFQNKDFRRGLEFQLTEALIKTIELHTPYKTTSNKGRADSVLTGQIIEVRQGTMGLDFKTHLPRETQATVVASFNWKDLRTGKVLVDMPLITQSVDYIEPVGENFYEASQEAMNDMAERIVEKMEKPW
ncbi:MAG: LptE family protein [Phycisphaerae bacterium]|nr:LptE family protein [Phycisphaerae bacterium]